MAKETRPKDYPKLKNYQPTRFMLPTSHYDKKKADRAVTFIENIIPLMRLRLSGFE